MNKVFKDILNELEMLKIPFPDLCPTYGSNTNGLIDKTKEIVKKVSEEYNGGWIPCSERYPDNDNYVLLSFENFSVPCVGRYEENENGGAFYIGDEDQSCASQDMFVNAWMPLPEQYKENEQINEANIVRWHPFKDYKYMVLSKPFEDKVIIMGINTDYVGYAPIDELECTGKTAKINIIMEGDTDE